MDELLQLLQEIFASGQPLPEEFVDSVLRFLESQQAPQAPALDPEIVKLWNLSGKNPRAFVDYLSNYPDPSGRMQGLLSDLGQFERVANQLLDISGPKQQPQAQDGIQKADLNSSNIYGFAYDPSKRELYVRFNGGSVYHYSGVPNHVFRLFQAGAFPARTSGKNEYGEWWVGKNPSLGAAFYEYIRKQPFPYARVA